ncbi:MAG: hypothetical protein KDA25_04125 [Phycisphaerales bacterium]|nr:hypothetical protein [Phycisphaerales bacterium]
MDRMRATWLGLVGSMLVGASAFGGDTTVWTVDVETSGEDVFWTSPTAVDPGASSYLLTSEIQLITVDISWNGIPFGTIDVTDQIPPDQAVIMAEIPGPAPVVLVDADIAYPLPPEPATLAAHLFIELDADGFAHADVTDVVLGTIDIDLGFPFGIQTVQLEAVHIVLGLTVESTTLGDLDGDGIVGPSDLAILLANWGQGGVGDLDGSGAVGAADLAILLANWGN